MLNINPLHLAPTVQTVSIDCPICGRFSFDAPDGFTITSRCFNNCPGAVFISAPRSKKLRAPQSKIDKRSPGVLK